MAVALLGAQHRVLLSEECQLSHGSTKDRQMEGNVVSEEVSLDGVGGAMSLKQYL